MGTTTYTISMFDIEDYVRSLQTGAVVGTPQHTRSCLIANTLKHKYPDKNGYVVGLNSFGFVGGQIVELNSDVRETAEKFDALWTEDEAYNLSGGPVTVEVLRERMPELFVGSKALQGEEANA